MLEQATDKLEEKQKKFQKQKIIKIVGTFTAAVLTYILSQQTYISWINLLFYSNKDAKVLKDAILKWVPENM